MGEQTENSGRATQGRSWWWLMGVVMELSVPGSTFALGRIVGRCPDATVELDRIVPTDGRVCPYLWVTTHDHSQFREAVEGDHSVESLRLVEKEGDVALYHFDWQPESGAFLDCVSQSDAAVLDAKGTSTRWQFTLRFDTHDHVRQFQEGCANRDIQLSIDAVTSGSVGDSPNELLSPCQRETIELALQRGYFDVPRRTTMVQLADELDISDQAVSARIRRGIKKLAQRKLSASSAHTESGTSIRTGDSN